MVLSVKRYSVCEAFVCTECEKPELSRKSRHGKTFGCLSKIVFLHRIVTNVQRLPVSNLTVRNLGPGSRIWV